MWHDIFVSVIAPVITGVILILFRCWLNNNEK
ncbi:type I toxin-antitoxin system Fst family toxin [Staphylococcus equorum]